MAFTRRGLYTDERFFVSKLTLQASVVLSIVILSHLSLVAGTDAQPEETVTPTITPPVTPPVDNQNSTQNTTSSVENQSSKSDTAGTVVIAIIITVLVCVAIVIGVFLYRRRRQSRMMDKEKKMQIQMSSARNAGVYQDLTVTVPADDKPSASAEHERLKAAEDA